MAPKPEVPASVAGRRIGQLVLVRETKREPLLARMDWIPGDYNALCKEGEGELTFQECENAAAFFDVPVEVIVGTHDICGHPTDPTNEDFLPPLFLTGDEDAGRRFRSWIQIFLGNNATDFNVSEYLMRATKTNMARQAAQEVLDGKRRLQISAFDRVLESLAGLGLKGDGHALTDADILGGEWAAAMPYVRGIQRPTINDTSAVADATAEELPDADDNDVGDETQQNDAVPADPPELLENASQGGTPVAVHFDPYNMPLRQILGDNVERIMRSRQAEKTLTEQRADLASVLGVSAGSVQNLWAGRMFVSEESLSKIAKHVGYSREFLLVRHSQDQIDKMKDERKAGIAGQTTGPVEADGAGTEPGPVEAVEGPIEIDFDDRKVCEIIGGNLANLIVARREDLGNVGSQHIALASLLDLGGAADVYQIRNGKSGVLTAARFNSLATFYSRPAEWWTKPHSIDAIDAEEAARKARASDPGSEQVLEPPDEDDEPQNGNDEEADEGAEAADADSEGTEAEVAEPAEPEAVHEPPAPPPAQAQETLTPPATPPVEPTTLPHAEPEAAEASLAATAARLPPPVEPAPLPQVAEPTAIVHKADNAKNGPLSAAALYAVFDKDDRLWELTNTLRRTLRKLLPPMRTIVITAIAELPVGIDGLWEVMEESNNGLAGLTEDDKADVLAAILASIE